MVPDLLHHVLPALVHAHPALALVHRVEGAGLHAAVRASSADTVARTRHRGNAVASTASVAHTGHRGWANARYGVRRAGRGRVRQHGVASIAGSAAPTRATLLFQQALPQRILTLHTRLHRLLTSTSTGAAVDGCKVALHAKKGPSKFKHDKRVTELIL